MSWTAGRCRSASLFGLLLVACGRLGFETSENTLTPRLGDPRHTDAGALDAAVPDALHDAATADASMDSGEQPMIMPGPDAAPDAAADASTADAAPPPPPPDPGCDSTFPSRIWPSASDVATCIDSFGIERSATGPSSADYTIFQGCSSVLEFEVSAGTELRLRTFGDGCVCTECSLYHLHYQIEEDLGTGFAPQLEVQEPDDIACPGGVEVENYTSYSPQTTRVRMRVLSGTTGAGFYFVVCGG